MRIVYYWDVENSELITVNDLKKAFETLKQEQPEEYDFPFSCYLQNCIESSLSPIYETDTEQKTILVQYYDKPDCLPNHYSLAFFYASRIIQVNAKSIRFYAKNLRGDTITKTIQKDKLISIETV